MSACVTSSRILAFLQNPWFLPGTPRRYVDLYRTNQDFHRRVLLLSATGRALHRALGSELYGRIHWDNANPLHGDTREAAFPPDPEHMLKTVFDVMPDTVILLGRQAREGWRMITQSGLNTDYPWPRVLMARHPMARGSAIEHMSALVRELR